MRRILIVEDEKLIREGIKASLEWKEMGLEFAGEAADGDAGLVMALELKPDIILTDVRMPGMDGIAMSQKILESLPKVKIIVISGYDDYKYVRQSLVLGLSDYLMKPVNDEQLKEVLKKVIAQIELEESKKKAEIEKRYVVAQSANVIKREVLNLLIRGNAGDIQWQKYGEIESFIHGFDKFMVAVVKVTNFDSVKTCFFQGDSDSLVFTLENICQEIINRYGGCQFFMRQDKKGDFILLKGIRNNAREQDIKLLKFICFDLVKTLKTSSKIIINIGVGTEKISAEGLKASYEEALSVSGMLSYFDAYQMVFYDAYKLNYTEEIFSSYEEIFIKSLKKNSMTCTLELLEVIYSKIKHDPYYPKAEIHKNVFKFINITVSYVNSVKGLQVKPYILEDSAILEAVDTFEEIWNWFTGEIQSCLKAAGLTGDTVDIIEIIKEFVDQNLFSQDISLGLLSGKYFINPYRLCKLFKSRYKENFQSYVINKRIEKAKELLRDSNIKVFETSELVGYADVKYFSRIFKKYTGFTPNEYRELKKYNQLQ